MKKGEPARHSFRALSHPTHLPLLEKRRLVSLVPTTEKKGLAPPDSRAGGLEDDGARVRTGGQDDHLTPNLIPTPPPSHLD